MKRVVIATHNQGKLNEIRELLEDSGLEIMGLDGFLDVPVVVEDRNTFYGNALKKARIASEHLGLPVIADDSGLEVDALGGKPGVYSSRFAGEDATDEDNNAKLLEMLKGVAYEKRTARFRCVVVLYIPNGISVTTEGTCEGVIGLEPKGTDGFGYDPLFIVPKYGKTFAELGERVKNRISHRANAFRELCRNLDDIALES